MKDEKKTEVKNPNVLSRTMRTIIENTIDSLPIEGAYNESVLLEHISNYFYEKYPNKKLEYQLSRMGIETTGDIKRAIQLYMTRYLGVE